MSRISEQGIWDVFDKSKMQRKYERLKTIKENNTHKLFPKSNHFSLVHSPHKDDLWFTFVNKLLLCVWHSAFTSA